MHNKQIGNIAEFAVAKVLSQQNLPVFKEMGDLTKVDLITIVNKKPITIQVKHAGSNQASVGSVMVRLFKTGPNGYYYKYDKTDFEILAVYVAEVDKVCFLNWDDIGDTKELSFRYKACKTNQSNIRLVENYLDLNKALKIVADPL